MTKQINLTRGKYAIVDDADFAYLSQWKWYCTSTGYAARKEPRGHNLYMHRLLANSPKGLETDHINGNKLDNRRSNLRPCTHSQNKGNEGLRSTNTSGYKGVTWHKQRQKWNAHITHNRKNHSLGLYATPEEASIAYNKEALKIFGNFAKPNERKA